MKTLRAFLVLTLIFAAGSAGAVLPAWGPGASLEEIQAILQAMRAQRERIPQRPSKLGEAEDVYKNIFASVDNSHIQSVMRDMSGENPVKVGGETFTISERYSPAAKANYRKY